MRTSTELLKMSSTLTRVLLRVSIGYLVVIWGADKLVNPAHGIRVSDGFYLGLFSQQSMMPVFGGLQILLGLLVLAGIWTRLSYPALTLLTGATLVGVWRSIVDPWGWYLKGTNALFYPSLIIFAAVLLLMAEDWQARPARDARRSSARQ